MNNGRTPRKILRRIIKFIFLLPYLIIRYIFIGIGKLKNKLIKRLRFSITFKITSIYAVILMLILFILSSGILAGFTLYLGAEAENSMLKYSKMISVLLDGSTELPEKSIEELSMLDNIDVNIFDEKRNLIYTTLKGNPSVIFYDSSNSSDISNAKGSYMWFHIENRIDSSNTGLQYIINNLRGRLVLDSSAAFNAGTIHIQVVDNLDREYMSLEALFLILSSAVGIFIVIILIIGSSASKRMLRPVDRMTKTVKNITINALDTRLDVSGSQDELRDLAQTFNNMLDRIQESYENQNQFVSDASHELRTPISVIQGYANLLDRWGKDDRAVLEESITAIKTEAESMKDLIDKLLFLARGDKHTQKVEKENFYINELVDEIIKETKMIDSLHFIVSDKNEAVMINADRKLIKEALRIFLDNSVKYTPEGGKITVNCASEKSQAVVSIEDTGIGIAKEDLPNIFNRFYRADKSRTKETGGTGLGLAIAKWIVIKHRGTIEVESRLNVGTKVTILLPKA